MIAAHTPENHMESQKVQAFAGIDLVDDKKIELVNGLPGFEHFKSFILAELEGYAPFYAFSAVEAPEISMLVIRADGIEVFADVHIPTRDLETIGLTNEDEAALYVVLKVDHESQKFIANTKAPLVFNFKNHLGNQIILEDPRLRIEYPLFEVADDGEDKQGE